MIFCYILHKMTFAYILQEQDKNINLNTSDNTSSDEDIHEDNSSNKENCFAGSSVFRKLQRPFVKDILKQSAQGRAILKGYERQKLLSRKCRNVIVDLILSDILNNIHGYIFL